MYWIYAIVNLINNKKYIGKSTNFKARLYAHRYMLKRETRHVDCNRHLHHAVKKYGAKNFKIVVIESGEFTSEGDLKERELFWMDHYNTCNRSHGYNLRRDSSTNCFMSEETKQLQSKNQSGIKNGNYGNHWNNDQKEKMSAIAKSRHKSGVYGNEWKAKIGKAASEMWKNEDLKNRMAERVSIAKEKYRFNQYKDGVLVRAWESVKDIIRENPEYKWQNIYSVCNGYKPTYRGYTWTKSIK